MAGFDAGHRRSARPKAAPRRVEFLHPPRADLEKAEVSGDDLARLTVRFLAEFRSRTKGPEGEASTTAAPPSSGPSSAT